MLCGESKAYITRTKSDSATIVCCSFSICHVQCRMICCSSWSYLWSTVSWFIMLNVLYCPISVWGEEEGGGWSQGTLALVDICTYVILIQKFLQCVWEFAVHLTKGVGNDVQECLTSCNFIRKHFRQRPNSLSSGQRFWLLIMRSRVRFRALSWGFFPDRGGSPLWPCSG
jgi:hypothetical protein